MKFNAANSKVLRSTNMKCYSYVCFFVGILLLSRRRYLTCSFPHCRKLSVRVTTEIYCYIVIVDNRMPSHHAHHDDFHGGIVRGCVMFSTNQSDGRHTSFSILWLFFNIFLRQRSVKGENERKKTTSKWMNEWMWMLGPCPNTFSHDSYLLVYLRP